MGIKTANFISTRRCDYLGCINNHQGKCYYNFSDDELHDLSELNFLICSHLETEEDICPNCGVKRVKYKDSHGFNDGMYEEYLICPICKE